MGVVQDIKPRVAKAITELYQLSIPEEQLTINLTKPEFEGDYTVVLFALIKSIRKAPEQLGQEIGQWLVTNDPAFFSAFNVIKGFLNLSIADEYWAAQLEAGFQNPSPGRRSPSGEKVIVEYSSPNTNKPLHLGHLRNNFLGWSVAEILKYTGAEVRKAAILNDRGIHICKSMIAWKLFGNGATPESTHTKGDHFVGDYYVLFGNKLKEEVSSLVADGMSKEEAEKEAPLMKAAQQMLLDWEKGDPEVRALWQQMNGWVYDGFNATYQRIGSDFDKNYYESNTYLFGKELVDEGLAKGVFFRKPDGSVWIDLTADGLDEKLVLRKDGTSVYITQDLGLADQKYEEFPYNQSIYVIADEQNYHMKVLKLILQKMGKPYANGIYHLSYGMVELPEGRMKTREGTVVDADDLLDELKEVARQKTEELGKTEGFDAAGLDALYNMISLGALKFFLLRVDPKKRIIFNPEESVDIHGFTATFVQYTHARICSILRKEAPASEASVAAPLLPREKEMMVMLEQLDATLEQALNEHNPSLLANYAFHLAKTYNSFYAEHSVVKAESEEKKQLRLRICALTAKTLRITMALMGIEVPERM